MKSQFIEGHLRRFVYLTFFGIVSIFYFILHVHVKKIALICTVLLKLASSSVESFCYQ